MKKHKIKILIADDHSLFRQGILELLKDSCPYSKPRLG